LSPTAVTTLGVPGNGCSSFAQQVKKLSGKNVVQLGLAAMELELLCPSESVRTTEHGTT